jgi:hypothetical protein
VRADDEGGGLTWRAFTSERLSMGGRPEFSASAMGMASMASAKARKAYCSTPSTWSAAASTASPHAISAAATQRGQSNQVSFGKSRLTRAAPSFQRAQIPPRPSI